MRTGWTTTSHNTKRLRPSPGYDHSVSIDKVHSVGKAGLKLSCVSLQGDNHREGADRLQLVLDPSLESSIAPWIRIKGARKLLLPGVRLRYEGERQQEKLREDNETVVQVKQIAITGALPTSPYLARLLTFSVQNLKELFGFSTDSHDLELFHHLMPTLEPCTLQQCQDLAKLCRDEKEAGRSTKLFKNHRLLAQVDAMLLNQGWKRKVRDPPSTKTQTWEALRRLEALYCDDDGACENVLENDEDDAASRIAVANSTANIEGEVHSSSSSSSNEKKHNDVSRLVYGGVDVDPSRNLPDLQDARRQRYIDERKRPQIVWMLDLIQKLLPLRERRCSDAPEAPRKLHLVDIGGGRGDLALAVAAHFQQHEGLPADVHVTVLDVNESSLQAGKERAKVADLSSQMSFELCDLGDATQVKAFRSSTTHCDLVFGLHCCGGVAEAAVELALLCEASFCVSTCCYCSNGHLASLTRLAEGELLKSTDATGSHKQLQRDRSMVTSLAVKPGAKGQHRAIHAVNAMRLFAAQKRFAVVGNAPGLRLRTWQQRFPVDYSVQNRVMVGQVVQDTNSIPGNGEKDAL